MCHAQMETGVWHPQIDLSIQDDAGRTALDVARYRGLTDIVELIESRLQSSRIV